MFSSMSAEYTNANQSTKSHFAHVRHFQLKLREKIRGKPSQSFPLWSVFLLVDIGKGAKPHLFYIICWHVH